MTTLVADMRDYQAFYAEAPSYVTYPRNPQKQRAQPQRLTDVFGLLRTGAADTQDEAPAPATTRAPSRPLVVAHQGASGYSKGNSLDAFALAIAQGADMVELDARLCASGEVVVYHDELTPSGEFVDELSLDEMRELTQAPLLTEVIASVGGRCPIYVDLKGEAIVDAVLAILREAVSRGGRRASDFLLASFNQHDLARARELESAHPGVPLLDDGMRMGVLTYGTASNLTACATDLGVDLFICDIEALPSGIVEDAHARGCDVWVYTLNAEAAMRRCVDRFGVDGIITDFVDRAHAVLGSCCPTAAR